MRKKGGGLGLPPFYAQVSLPFREAEGTDSARGVGEVQQVEPRGERVGGYHHGLRPVVAAGQHRLPQGVHHAQRP